MNYVGRGPSAAYPQAIFSGGHLYGGILSNAIGDLVNDISVTTGECRDSANASDIRWVALTKQLDSAWAAGNGVGMRDTGAIANGTWHIFAIRDANGNGDILASLSPTAPTMPAGYVGFRRIGSILREAATIVPFVQDGDLFQRKVVGIVGNFVNPGTAAVLRAVPVPTGLELQALLFVGLAATTSGAGTSVFVTDPAVNDETADRTARSQIASEAAQESISGAWAVRTNALAQVRTRMSHSGVADALRLTVRGWIDTRGRDA